MVIGTGQYQVAQSGQTHEGLQPPPQGGAETRQFRQATGNEGRAGVGTEAQPIRDAGGDGQDILGRPAHLNSDEVVAGIGAEPLAMEVGRHPPRLLKLGRGHRDRRGQAPRHLGGKARARNNRHITRPQDVQGYLVQEAIRPRLQALSGPGQPHVGSQGRQVPQQGREAVAGHDDQDLGRALEGLTQIRYGFQVVR